MAVEGRDFVTVPPRSTLMIQRRHLVGFLAIVLGAAPVHAQRPAASVTLAVEAGPSFPTGGDFNDVYKVGYHAGFSAEHELASRVALRVSTDYDVFGHDTIKPQYGEDRQWGRSVYATLDGVVRGPRRLYVLGGVGYYDVHAAFLALDGHVIPAATQREFGVDAGLGVRLTSAWALEIRHHDALRRREGIARWMPLSLRHAI